MNLTDLSTVRDIMDRFGISTKKKYGQNFLINQSVPERIAKEGTGIENCGVLTTGKTILEAFDRLEVSEFTAKCIIMASRLGELSPINDQQVSDIIDAFKLPVK